MLVVPTTGSTSSSMATSSSSSTQEPVQFFVLLVTPYKVGCCYVSKVLSDNNVPHVRLHSYDADERAKYPPEQVTHFITVERECILDLHISAYFADMHQGRQHYPYAFTDSLEKAVSAPMRDIVNHFFRQDWSAYRWLNYDYYRGWMRWFARRGVPSLTLYTEKLSENITHQALAAAFSPAEELEEEEHGPHQSSKWIRDPKPCHVTSEHAAHGSMRYLAVKSAIRAEHTRRMYWINRAPSIF